MARGWIKPFKRVHLRDYRCSNLAVVDDLPDPLKDRIKMPVVSDA